MPLSLINTLTGQRVTAAPWQEALKVGDCYVIENPLAPIVIRPGQQTDIAEDLPKIDGLNIYGKLTGKAGATGFFKVRAYSALCPEGEGGIACVLDFTRQITRAEFDAAVKNLQEKRP